MPKTTSNGNGAHVETQAGTGTPPVTPNLGLPRYSNADPADYPTQTNAIVDLLDVKVGRRGVAVTSQPVLDVGMVGQVRAGRQLTAADFTSLGLSAPQGLWNLSDLTDASGNGRALSNKGAVPFGPGINGAASTAAVFAGSTGQALYISDTGAADPFRIGTGSFGCWFRTAKRATFQALLSKYNASQVSWYLGVSGAAVPTLTSQLSTINSGWQLGLSGVSDIADDRWHHGVVTYDGAVARIYCDGILEGVGSPAPATPLASSNAPLNIGGSAADGATAATSPAYGRVDEAFVTNDVLSDDQIRGLYCAKIAHGFSVTPTVVNLAVRRARKGGPLAPADFPTPPLRLHNFTNGALADQGSNGVALTNVNATSMAGADGASGNAFGLVGTGSLYATDAGLPAGTASRSYGCWFKTTTATGTGVFIAWGTVAAAMANMYVGSGVVNCDSGTDHISGPFVADGSWHYAAAVEDNSAGDGVRRKLYLDGRLVAGSTGLASLTLAGATHFRVGANADGGFPFTGQIDGAFVCDIALPQDAISRLYAKGSQTLPPSAKNAGDHVEAMDATNIYVAFDTLDTQHTIDLGVSG